MTDFAQDLDPLVRRLAAAALEDETRGQAVMVVPVNAGSGASTIASALAEDASGAMKASAWLFDLDFSANTQAGRAALNGAAYNGDLHERAFWRAEPRGVSRLALRKRQDSPVLVSVFQREPGRLRRVIFQRAPDYWAQVRAACRLAVIDAPYGSPAINTIAPDLDGVILVADARRDRRSEAERAARNIETAGGTVLGVVVNRADPLETASLQTAPLSTSRLDADRPAERSAG